MPTDSESVGTSRVSPSRPDTAATGPIWADETFLDLTRVIRSTALLAAVRSATVGMPGGQAAAAPFRSGQWLFSHNGAVDGWPEVAGQLAWGLDPGVLATLEAPTDSALLWAMTRDLLARGKTPESALAEVVARAVDAGGGRLTFLLTDGHRIVATAWGTSLCWRQLASGCGGRLRTLSTTSRMDRHRRPQPAGRRRGRGQDRATLSVEPLWR